MEAADIVDVDLGVKVITLGEVAKEKLSYGSGSSAIEYDGKTRLIRITDIDVNGTLKEEKVSPSQVEEKYYLENDDILFARSGASVGKNYIHKVSEREIYAGYLIRLRVNKEIAIPKFVYYSVNTSNYELFVSNKRSMASQPNINAQEYSKFKILLPPMEVQNETVDILDKFNALLNDIETGLPREIELRQKQYEYYRDKLLNFSRA